MRREQELEREPLDDLARRCSNVAINPSVDSPTAEKARILKLEWAKLIARETPPNPSLDQQRKVEAEKEKPRGRVVEFLAGAEDP